MLLMAFVVLGTQVHAANFSIDLANNPTQIININGALYTGSAVGAGSGVYTRLFAIQDSPVEEGYNYDGGGANPFDQKNGSFNPHLELGDVPVITVSGTQYLAFTIDLNNSNGLALEEFRLYINTDPTNTPVLVTGTANLGNLGTLVYNFDGNEDNTLTMTTVPAGSGYSDMTWYVPLALVSSYSYTDNVYAYIKYSGADGGFEEFAIDKSIPQNFYSLIPEPATVGAGLFIVPFLFARRRRKS